MGHDRSVKLSDVARQAGVSLALASRVLNHDPSIRAKDSTRDRVWQAARDLDYVPHSAARALRQGRSGVLGMAIHDHASPVFADLLAGARAAASETGNLLLLGDADELTGDPVMRGNYIASGRLDGLIVQAGHGDLDHEVDRIARSVPTVVVNSVGSEKVPGVRVPDRAAARMATEHLLELGHRDIGYLDGPRDSYTASERRAGVTDALDAAGVRLRNGWAPSDEWTAQGGHRSALAMLREQTRPTAVVAANLLIGAGAVRAASDHGVTIPADLSIVAIHDSWIAGYLVPSLTTVALPLREMGRRAVALLLAHAGGERVSDVEVTDPPPQLIRRASTSRASHAS